MTNTAKSVFGSGIYYAVTGLWLLILPHTFLDLFRFPPTDDLWVRLSGLLLSFLAYYYIRGALSEDKEIFHCTVFDRLVGAVVMLLFVILGYPVILILFTVADLVLALITIAFWRQEARRQTG